MIPKVGHHYKHCIIMLWREPDFLLAWCLFGNPISAEPRHVDRGMCREQHLSSFWARGAISKMMRNQRQHQPDLPKRRKGRTKKNNQLPIHWVSLSLLNKRNDQLNLSGSFAPAPLGVLRKPKPAAPGPPLLGAARQQRAEQAVPAQALEVLQSLHLREGLLGREKRAEQKSSALRRAVVFLATLLLLLFCFFCVFFLGGGCPCSDPPRKVTHF